MKITNTQLVYYSNLAKNANTNQIKALTQSERKALTLMLDAIKRGKEEFETKSITEQMLGSINDKFTKEQTKEPTLLVLRIIKSVMNFFRFRISSEELSKKIAFIKQYGTNEKYQVIKKERSNSRKAISKINRKINTKQIEEFLTVKKDLTDLKGGYTNQFHLDYTRGGMIVKISDPQNGVFQGKSKSVGCSDYDNLHFHGEGLSKIFGPGEENWRRLAEVNINQTPYNTLGHPLSNELLVGNDGMMRTVNIHSKEYSVQISKQGNLRLPEVKVFRDKFGKIQKLEVRHFMRSKLILHPEEIYIGTVKSNLSYTVSFAEDGETPVIRNLRCRHAFSEKPIEQITVPEPGFYPIEQEKEPTLTPLTKQLVFSWKKDLTKMKLSTRPTAEKVKYLQGRIEDIKKVRDQEGIMSLTLNDKFEVDTVISHFQKYLNDLKIEDSK